MKFGSPFFSPKYTLIDGVRGDIWGTLKVPKMNPLTEIENNSFDLFILRSIFMHFCVRNMNKINFLLFAL